MYYITYLCAMKEVFNKLELHLVYRKLFMLIGVSSIQGIISENFYS